MHHETYDSSGTPLPLLHGGLFDIHRQFDEQRHFLDWIWISPWDAAG